MRFSGLVVLHQFGRIDNLTVDIGHPGAFCDMRHWRSIRDEADVIWREAVLLRDKGRCQFCGEESGPPHHIFLRSNWLTRYDCDCGIALCVKCHDYAQLNMAESFDRILLRLDLTDKPRAAKLRRYRDDPVNTAGEPVWDNVLSWVKDQDAKITEEVAWTDDIEAQYGRTTI
jgi:hypothetical protein